jgi:predicted nucleotidyltransferase
MTERLKNEREKILRIAARYGAHNVRVFGSVARGEESLNSDIDIVVDLEKGRSLLDQVGLKQELEELLGQSIDVVVEGGISPYLQERILSEAVPL